MIFFRYGCVSAVDIHELPQIYIIVTRKEKDGQNEMIGLFLLK